MNSLISTFGYQGGNLIRAQVKAVNSKGTGPDSTESTGGVLAKTAPISAPTNIVTIPGINQITLSWTQVTRIDLTGYSDILYYKIYINSGTGFNFA